MTQTLKSALTLGTLCLILLVAALWGWQALTEPFPEDEEAPLCSDISVAAGDEVFSEQVAVSVYNGSSRSGLAGATLEQLEGRGFIGADSGNAPKAVNTTEIWSDEPNNAAVRLVARQFKKARVVSGEELGRGVVVVVGKKFKELRQKDVPSVEAREDSTFCGVATY